MTESTPVPGEASVEKPHTGLGTSIVEALAPQLDAIGCRIARRCAGSDRVRKKAWTTGQTDDISIASKALNAEISLYSPGKYWQFADDCLHRQDPRLFNEDN